jgi:hypothetical protein
MTREETFWDGGLEQLAFEFLTTDKQRWTRIREIPKGFYQSARRCEERATPGNGQNKIKTPTEFYQRHGAMIQLFQS